MIFTAPEMSSVGLTEEQCKEKGLNYKTGSFPFAASGAMTLQETDGFVRSSVTRRPTRSSACTWSGRRSPS